MDDLKHAYDLQSHPVSEETTAYVTALQAEVKRLTVVLTAAQALGEEAVFLDPGDTITPEFMKLLHALDEAMAALDGRAALEGNE